MRFIQQIGQLINMHKNWQEESYRELNAACLKAGTNNKYDHSIKINNSSVMLIQLKKINNIASCRSNNE